MSAVCKSMIWSAVDGDADRAERSGMLLTLDGLRRIAARTMSHYDRYEPGARLTLHQDRNERDFSQPIVSVSLGLPAVFVFGGPKSSDRAVRVPLMHERNTEGRAWSTRLDKLRVAQMRTSPRHFFSLLDSLFSSNVAMPRRRFRAVRRVLLMRQP